MRLVLRIQLGGIAPHAVICAAIALLTLPMGAVAQQVAPAQSATLTESAGTGSATLASPALAAVASPATAADPQNDNAQIAADGFSTPAAGSAANAFSLDDQMLSRQRGGAIGMLMVAGTPQLMRGSSNGTVTLWDEIAPPSPLPIPVDAARAAQGNVANYQRK
ncbi:MAG TPA: hypothetical protein VFE79_11125 [Paraburkholderia sp.]|jgi:hypothetical protein|nr:hypothetical protein [Paraburkholderia sp.]